jgi:glycosyltransferase involved in cell wall biosynthesis
MKVWIFQSGEPLHSDGVLVRPMRAMNLANALVDRGHRVILWSSAFYHQEKKYRALTFESIKINDNLEIRLIPSPGYNRNIGPARLFDHFILSLNLKKELSSQLSMPDMAFVGYPPIESAYVMIRWLSAKGIPTLLDVKDQWPSLLVSSVPQILRPLTRFLLSPYYYIARRAMLQATGVCAMSQSFLNWALMFSGREQNSFDRVVPLTSPESALETDVIVQARKWWVDQNIMAGGATFRLMFVGSFSRAFDFDALFVAAHELIERKVNCEFILCGDGELAPSLREKAKACPNIKIIEWIDRPKIVALSECSSVVLAPYKNSSDFIASIPNKVIDALMLGLPLLSPLQGEVFNLINSNNTGLSYGEISDKTLADCIIELINNPQMQKTLAKNARKLYDEKFSFDYVYGGLVDHLEGMVITK